MPHQYSLLTPQRPAASLELKRWKELARKDVDLCRQNALTHLSRLVSYIAPGRGLSRGNKRKKISYSRDQLDVDCGSECLCSDYRNPCPTRDY
jgi:hypothetical protein